MGFPFFAADLGAIAKVLLDDRYADGTSFTLDLAFVPEQRREAVLSAYIGLMQALNVPTVLKPLIASTHLIKDQLGLADRFVALTSDPDPKYAMKVSKDAVYWEEDSPWPAAFAGFLSQLENITQAGVRRIVGQHGTMEALLNANGFDASNQSHLDQVSRVMPTDLHYAASSLGAWGGGAINMQFLAYYCALSQLQDCVTNRVAAEAVGYTDSEAQALTESGLIAIPPSLTKGVFDEQGDNVAFGGIAVDEINLANFPSALDEPPDRKFGGLLLDKHYRTTIRPRPLDGYAMYGARNVLRDHYREFYERVDCSELIRCKVYCAPVIDVSSRAELEHLISTIPIRSDSGMFYRGQSSLFPLQRDPGVQKLLFGSSVCREPSLNTQATRKNFDYDALHYALRFFIQDQVVFGPNCGEPFEERYRRWRGAAQSEGCEVDYALMALAQHYGIPTHGLDVTSSVDVATWFATNNFDASGPLATYHKRREEDWGDVKAWPVIFACQQVTWSLGQSLKHCHELSVFGLTAKRPERQKASFFHGGHGDHQNRLAETVVCAFRLRPGRWPTEATFDELFPAPEDDPGYAAMLAFASAPAFADVGASSVVRYAHG